MIGGPCGRPIYFPNPKVKRGWSFKQPLWRFETGLPLDDVIWCADERYVLRTDAKGKPCYVHEPDLALLHAIALAIGTQRFWLARYPELRALSGFDGAAPPSPP